MAYLIGLDGRVHIHRRFADQGESEAWCGHRVRPVYLADFVKVPRQHQQQCLRCQDVKHEEGKR